MLLPLRRTMRADKGKTTEQAGSVATQTKKPPVSDAAVLALKGGIPDAGKCAWLGIPPPTRHSALAAKNGLCTRCSLQKRNNRNRAHRRPYGKRSLRH